MPEPSESSSSEEIRDCVFCDKLMTILEGFSHASAIKSDHVTTLTEGQRVEFSVTQGPKGPQAESIVAI